MNALGIGADGETAYAINRSGSNAANVVGVYSYDATTGAWVAQGNSGYTTGVSGGSLVAGAVDLSSGLYIYGVSSSVSQGWTTYARFNLFSYDPATNTHQSLGYVQFPFSSMSPNGDFAFDTAGNLYIVASGTGYVRRTVVSSSVLQAAVAAHAGNNASIANTPQNQYMNSNTFNGVAFDSDGTMFAGTTSTVFTYSPTWSNPVTVATGLSSVDPAVDLASCASPPSLLVKKNLAGARISTSDQFVLSIPGTSADAATTTGSASGVQKETANATNLTAGSTYSIAEAMASGSTSALSAYSSSWTCLNGTTVIASRTGTSGSVTLPALIRGQLGANVVCTFTNTPPAPATVTITKMVQDTNGQNPTAASGWNVGATLASGGTSGTTITTPASKTTGSNGSAAPWTVSFPSVSATTGLTISETQQTGYSFVSGTCIVTPASGTARTVTLTGVTGTVSGVNPGDEVACTFTNKQQSGSATWQKIASDTAKTPLSGSQWTLTGPGVPANTVVSDCTSTPCATGAYADTDPASGAFKLAGLAWGDYTLTEKTAPVGYVLDTTVRQFTISATSLSPTVTGSPFSNAQQAIPKLPLTGGASADAYLMAGAVLLMLSCALGIIGVRRRKGDAKRH
jgi:LPXTG-motif cell wall-anchored protein